MLRLLPLLCLALVASGCSKKAKFEKLCDRIQELACKEEVLAMSGGDRMTVIVGELSEDSKAYEEVLSPLANVAPVDRLRLLKGAVSEITETDWQCPVLDTVWAGGDPTCIKKQ